MVKEGEISRNLIKAKQGLRFKLDLVTGISCRFEQLLLCLESDPCDRSYIRWRLEKSSRVTCYQPALDLIKIFRNCRLIRRIQQNNFWNIKDLTKDWTEITCLDIIHSNHYSSMLPVLRLFLNHIHAWVILSNSPDSSKWMIIFSFWKKTRMFSV